MPPVERIAPAVTAVTGDAVTKEFLRQFFSLDQPQLVIETVKAAQDGRGLIVRLYETRRTRGKAKVSCGFPIKNALQTNILEEDQLEIKPAGNQLEFSYKPYQIITLRIIPD